MAKKRDVIAAVLIVGAMVVAFGFFGLMFIGALAGDGEFEISGFGERVGVIELFDVITEETGRPVVDQIDDWADDNSIKAIVIHLNTPGGGVSISQEIYDAVKRAADHKPVVAAMASVAASGGYYIACGADRVIANPGTITGSIGVIFQFYTFEDLFGKIGVGTETVKSGELKDVGNPSRAMTKKEELMLRSVVMDSYEQFVAAIAEGRGMSPDDIYPLADGSVYTGLQAYNLGLVDTLGGLKEAVDLAGELADIKGLPALVRPYKKRKIGILDLMEGILRKLDSRLEQTGKGPELMYLYR
ncbi:MAG: signal peptide peptidase SppA [bacterium]|nr:signal peptide peptidase SppA [bacterium]